MFPMKTQNRFMLFESNCLLICCELNIDLWGLRPQ
uniref:Uncharacterized protein n=1 Tax=Anguilla anguilla TaxID=7936 RepID=A0A0E9P8X6_ANGAN